MNMKTRFRLLLAAALLASGLLAGCSSLQLPFVAAQVTTAPADNNPSPDQAAQSLEGRLALGTFGLEGTPQAVSAEQAQRLLPLWKAVKALSSSETASQDELSALYSQIKETMTEEQVQAIEAMRMTPEETNALMEKYGIEMPQNPIANLSDDQRATRIAQFQAEGGQMPERGQGGAGGPGGQGFQGGMPPEGGFPGRDMQSVQGTPQPGRNIRGMRAGMNLMFVDPLIQLLQERAGG